jgi:hypothetical protein
MADLARYREMTNGTLDPAKIAALERLIIVAKRSSRATLTRLGVFTLHPAAFVIVFCYVASWLVFSPARLDWRAIATVATWS